MGSVRLVCKYFTVCVVVVLAICIIRTAIILSLQRKKLAKCQENESVGYLEVTDQRWQRFRDALRFRTISYAEHVYEKEELTKLVEYILQAYPDIFKSKHVEYEIVNSYSLLIHVKGRNASLTPYILAAHMDVVPAIEEEWMVDPFAAVEDDAKTLVYGRGAIDCKVTLIGMLNAVEFMMQKGFIPDRGFYMAFGHDEEVSGFDGAAKIADTLRAKGVSKVHFLLDEGMPLLRNAVPGLNKDIGAIGVSEKGFLTLNISVALPGGHSSMPPRETAIGILSQSIDRLLSNPMPGIIDDMVAETMEAMAAEAMFPFNVMLTNLWLFRPLWSRALSKHRIIQGLVRSTTAVTIIGGGMKSNVIPAAAWAIANHRIHPTNTIEEMIQYDKDIINDDRVQIDITRSTDVPPVSPFDRDTSLPYQVITDTMEQIFDDFVLAPSTFLANTDTTWYLGFTKHVYRHFPLLLEQSDVDSIHAKNEKMSRENFGKVMNFYNHLIRNADRVKLRSLVDFKQEL